MDQAASTLVKSLKNRLLPYRGERLILAYSGGLDSLALGQALSEIVSDLRIGLSLAHVHHGPSENVEQSDYRDLAARAAEKQAQLWSLPFYLRKSVNEIGTGSGGPSEEAYRDFRSSELEALRSAINAAYIVTAHHRDDLIETRLLRLLRGTGVQGLPAMVEASGHYLRPWLEVTRKDIESFAQFRGLIAVEDPSNKNSTAMRNWIRNEWLPQLENKQPGATDALARSLTHVVQSTRVSAPQDLGVSAWDRRRFDDLSALDRRAAVAKKLRDLGARHFSQTQIEEIVKRLDTVQKRLEFVVAGVEFNLNAQQIHSRLQ